MNKINYPYPVLEKYRDDIIGKFSFRLKVSWDAVYISVSPEFILDNDELKLLIQNGEALFYLQIECKKTFYREIMSFGSEKPSLFLLDAVNFKEQIEFKAYIGSTTQKDDYQLSSFHEDYNGYKFSLSKGNILGIGGTIKILIDKEYDELFPIKSFMEIVASAEIKMMKADYDSDKIIISLPEKDYEEYVVNKKTASGIFHSAIVLPVLVEALNLYGDENLAGNKWHNILENIISKRNIDLQIGKLNAAQEILSNPLSRTFDNIKKLNEE
jgi:hypothetical protein